MYNFSENPVKFLFLFYHTNFGFEIIWIYRNKKEWYNLKSK